MQSIITGKNLRKNYGEVAALKGISFSIRPGECFGFLGHNGAGKSTTMRMIYGLSVVEEGYLEVLGQAIKGLTPPQIKSRLGIVPQEDNLDPDLSVLENLEAYGGYFGLSRSYARERGLELLAFMGLSEKRKANVETLSGGGKRRLVIARALMNQPQILILDEPTTGLDPQGRRLVWQKLRQLREEGVTMLLTTHYMEEASQMCDRLVIMNDGKILAEGTPRQLVDEYLLPEVIEVHMPLETLPPDIGQKLQTKGGHPEYIAGGMFIFTREGQTLWEQLGAMGLPQHACYLRPAGLEDVFLKLTGRRDEA